MGKSRNRKTEKKDDPAIKIGLLSVADDHGSSPVGGVTRRNRRSKNPSTDADADAGAGAENQPPQLPRRCRRRHHKLFVYLAIVAVSFLLFKPLKVSIRGNLRSWLVGPRETETSYEDESEIASRKILRFLPNKFAEMSKKSNVPCRSGIRAPRLAISTRERRSASDDLDAVDWLSLLNDTYNRDRLCELGGMFLIAKQVDKIHRIPWIGFQSWHAAARKVSLSTKAEKVLEEAIQAETIGDVIFYWARTDMNSRIKGWSKILNFWSLCDILNGGLCREAFESSFRKMYGLPKEMVALPPMPDDGDHWSILHCWAMPTPSFLEFIMFSRMFVDSLDSFNHNSKVSRTCLLSSTTSEEKHCYCRMLELLINVWAYHSARKMVYINPVSGFTVEQHPVEQRKGVMWAKYFNSTLLKSMDEDLAEEAEDRDHPSGRWLWPLTGDMYCKLIHDREKDERRRQREEKQRRAEAKLREKFERGPKQTALGKH